MCAIDTDYHEEHWLCLRPDFIAFAFALFLLACEMDGSFVACRRDTCVLVCIRM